MKEEKWSGCVKGYEGGEMVRVCEDGMREENLSGYEKWV